MITKINKRIPRLDLNPSAADRWMTCTASPGFILANADKLPPDDGTVFSKEGTTAHEVAAAFLQDREPNLANCPTPIDVDMEWHGWTYADYVRGLRKPGGQIIVEQKLPLFYAESRNAIVDAAVINPGEMHVIDFKYGEGIIVSPIENLQATIYAKSVVWNWPKFGFPGKPVDKKGMSWAFDQGENFPVHIHIYQPRGRNASDSPFHIWTTTVGDIHERAKAVFHTACDIQEAQNPATPTIKNRLTFAPSEKACQWCPAKGFCNHRHQDAVDKLELAGFGGNQTVLNVNQLSKLLLHKEDILKWFKDAEAYALQFMKGGGKIPGFKLVTSRGGNRYWSNPMKAASILLLDTILKREEVIEERVIGPAAAEKLLGKHKFGAELMNLIAKPPGQPCIATEDDPRESCLLENAAGEFDDLDEDDLLK